MVGLAITRPMQHITPPVSSVGGHQSSSYHTPAGSLSGVKDRYQQRSCSTLNSRSQNWFPDSFGTATSVTSTSALTGLRTPPPERRIDSITMQPHSYVDGPFLKQFEPPIPSNVPKMVDSFLPTTTTTQQYYPRLFDSPPSRRGSVISRCSSADKNPVNPTSGKSSSTLTDGLPTYKMSESRRNSRAMQLPPLPALFGGVTRGTIADFAAEMICFFWFESSFLLHRIEESNEVPGILAELSADSLPTAAFRRWVTNILTTTQVSTNVILLALLFVYRLKKLNPSVRGKPGSEYRMITVALMLGNKFLDDNTYTNKTRAEVSGMTVKEIHVMEVEFLQNMKYNLFTSEIHWMDWQYSILKLWRYWDGACRMALEITARPQRSPVSAVPLSFPSPPNSQQSSPAMMGTNFGTTTPTLPYPLLMPHTLPAPMPTVDLPMLPRKRSIEEQDPLMQPPPSKRLNRSRAPTISIDVPQFPVQIPPHGPPSAGRIQRLAPASSSGSTQTPMLVPSLQSGQLPLPAPGHRAMSMVFPSPNLNWNQPSYQALTSAVPPTHNITIPTFNSQSRNSSPYMQNISNTPSPTSAFPNSQQQRLSPSTLLGNRPSPYRPVRGVSSLLIPPVATNPAPTFNMDQIQYHSIAKTRTQYKTGVLPYLPNEYLWDLPVPHHPQ